MGALDQNYIVKSENGTDISNLINSQIYDNGTNVGIGTTSPSEKFTVRGSNVRIKNEGTSNTAYNVITANNSDGDPVELVAYGRSASGTYLGQSRAGGLFVGASPNAVMGVGTRNAKPLVLGTNDTERMRILSGGNVGIGTTSPGAKLEVAGGMIISDGAGKESIVVVDKPSGTAATDTANINNAITAVADNGGGTVILQLATYYISKTDVGSSPNRYSYGILLKQGVVLKGVSMCGTILKANENGLGDTERFSIIYMQEATSGYSTGFIKDLTVHANSKTSITGLNIGDYYADTAHDAQPFYVENVYVAGCKIGMEISSYFAEVHNCKIYGCVSGIDVMHRDGTPNSSVGHSNAVGIYHCHIWGNASYNMTNGIYVHGICNQIIGCNIGNINTNGKGIEIYADDTDVSNYITGNYIEANTSQTGAIGIYIAAKGNTVIGNHFDLPTAGNEIQIASGHENGNVILANWNERPASESDKLKDIHLNAPVNVRRTVGTATGKQQVADFAVYGNSANTHLVISSDGNDNSANWINTSGAEQLRLGTGNQTNMLTVDDDGVGVNETSPDCKLHVNGTVKFENLPTSNPHDAGALWNDGGTLKVSAG